MKILTPAVSLILALALTAAAAGVPLKASKRTALKFPDGKTINADVVDTPLDRERGLMFRTNLPPDYGMLFIFPHELPMSFWMKNTLVSLDIVFIGSDKKVTIVHSKVKASKLDTPDDAVARAGGSAQFVLELPAGAAAKRKLKAGDVLKFEAAIPER